MFLKGMQLVLISVTVNGLKVLGEVALYSEEVGKTLELVDSCRKGVSQE